MLHTLVLVATRNKLEITNISKDPKEISKCPRKAWAEWHAYKDEEHVKREGEILNQISEADKQDEEDLQVLFVRSNIWKEQEG